MKIIISAVSLFTCMVLIFVGCFNIFANPPEEVQLPDAEMQLENYDTWWENYRQLPRQTGVILDRVRSALEYSGWTCDPEDVVIEKLSEYYGEPLRSEIIQSVIEFREAPTDWHYTYQLAELYLIKSQGDYTTVIAEINEYLDDNITSTGLALLVLNHKLQIIDQDFKWEY
ncbi:MAG: hypothetical protein AB1420_14835 [Bacillota bacterium]